MTKSVYCDFNKGFAKGSALRLESRYHEITEIALALSIE
jgi:hypothetical protein